MRRALIVAVAASALVVVALLAFLREPSADATDPSPERAAELALRDVGDLVETDAPTGGADDARVVDAGAARESDERRAEEEKLAHFVENARVAVDVLVVCDEDGRPLAGADVHCSAGEFDPSEAVKSDADGRVRFEKPVHDVYVIEARADGCMPARTAVRLAPGARSCEAVVRLAFRRDVLVRVVDPSGRELVRGAHGFDEKSVHEIGIAVARACTRPGGRFPGVDGPPHRARRDDAKDACAWRLEIHGREAVSVHALIGDVVLACEDIDAWREELVLRIDAAALRGASDAVLVRVVDEGANAVVGARVVFRRVGGEVVERVTDRDGRARVDALLAGQVVVEVDAAGYGRWKETLRRPIDVEVLVALQAGRRIAGVALDQDGAPLPRARVLLYSAEEAGSSKVPPLLARTDSALDGTFEFSERRPGRYAVAIDAGGTFGRLPRVEEWGPSVASADVRHGDALGLVLRGARPRNDVGGEDWNPRGAPAIPK